MSRTVACIALAAFAFAGSGIATAYAGVPQTASGLSKVMEMNGVRGKARKGHTARANSAVIQIALSSVAMAQVGRFADPIPAPGPIDLRSTLRIEGIAPVLTRVDVSTLSRPAKPESSWRDFRVADTDREAARLGRDAANGQDKMDLTLSCRGTGGTAAAPHDMVCEAGFVLSLM